jgi:hypothetical protein
MCIGEGKTETVLVAKPQAPALYVIVAVPGTELNTDPVLAPIGKVLGSLLLHVPPPGMSEKVATTPVQISGGPVIGAVVVTTVTVVLLLQVTAPVLP